MTDTNTRAQKKSFYERMQEAKFFAQAFCEVTAPIARGAYHAVRPIARAGWVTLAYCARHTAPAAKSLALFMATKKDAEGKRHFHGKRLIASLAITGAVGFTAPYALPAVEKAAHHVGVKTYYTLMEETYDNVYVPDAAVFIDQKPVDPKAPIDPKQGRVFSVMGKVDHGKGDIENVLFVIEHNPYYFYYEDSMQPEIAASKLNSQSPYGVKCTLRTTGAFNWVPRFIRAYVSRNFDLHPEIVQVKSVVELQRVPAFSRVEQDLPTTPTGSVAIPAPVPTALPH